MKIVFKNKEEGRRLMLRLCPTDIDEDFEDRCKNNEAYYNIGKAACLDCWLNCGVEIEVENDG